MAKNRMVNTIFWEDNYTANLDPIEKLLFLYFLTNSSTSICGIYQITLKKIAVETGIDKEMVEKILGRFANDKKIFYEEGWVGIKNFTKHQNQNSPKIKKGIEIELENVPKSIKKMVLGKGIDTLSHLNSNLNSNSNSNTKRDGGDKSPTPAQDTKDFFTNQIRQDELVGKLVEKGMPEVVARSEVNKFIDYWTELNQSGTKQRWQQEKAFELRRRLSTWFSNAGKFNTIKKSPQGRGIA